MVVAGDGCGKIAPDLRPGEDDRVVTARTRMMLKLVRVGVVDVVNGCALFAVRQVRKERDGG